MIDLQPVIAGTKTVAEVVGDLTQDDLTRETNALIYRMLELIAECDDADVVFQPTDPGAHDPAAADAAEAHIAWTLGHVVVHVTAGGEEQAFLAAEQARGVAFHGRSRYEVPWETVTTLAQVRARLEESRRMMLACLAVWPDAPHLALEEEVWPGGPRVNAVGRHAIGLAHGFGHLAQIAEIVRQSRGQKG
ncbi:MAG: DinB family protein [Candidatus Viridilinea halotolerans]|uniref:DinB family protein n=1 Tax=Candidatus Viridilinea halotolerans TaxID=2491704 RepID=A0A426U9T7_9CHLR|nr:MAG: DinB family protein [Candidatus Viridilinea halotolerans]